MPDERWYEPGELEEMSRPTMDRAIEAIEAGDLSGAVELCRGMKYEWRFLHDLMAESMLGLITFIQEQLRRGRGGRRLALVDAARLEERHRRDPVARPPADRGSAGRHLARAIPPPRGPRARPLHDRRRRQKFTFRMNPCGSGQRLWRRGMYSGEKRVGVTSQAHDWS